LNAERGLFARARLRSFHSFDGADAMLVNVLLFIFVAGFVATVALGQVLLVVALWPGTPGEPVKRGPRPSLATSGKFNS
jgi:hypothetical protein